MALQKLNFTFKAEGKVKSFPETWSHTGVVGSGDMEILINHKEQNGNVTINVTTPVSGFDDIWGKVLKKFVDETNIGNVHMEINDNNATPVIVSMRLRQALLEATEVE